MFAVLIPNLDLPVAAGGDEVAAVAELHREGAAAVGRPAFDLFAVEHLPEPHGAILTRGGDHVRVEPPTQSRDVVAMAVERVKEIAGERLPDVQAAVAISAGQQHGVR